MFCFLFCVFCVFVLFCILFLPIYIAIYFIFLHKFTDHCHRVENQLQLINTSYHIIYIHTHIYTIPISPESSGNPTNVLVSNTSLITPTKCTTFIHYIYLPCLIYTFRCYVQHHHGELCVLYLSTACRKVAGSIVNGIFHWDNPSGRTMALGSTQPPTEMSTRNISWVG